MESMIPLSVGENIIIAILWMQSEPLTDKKLNRSTLSMPNALSCKMTGAKLVRCISGTVEAGSFSKSSSGEHNRGNKTNKEGMREERWGGAAWLGKRC